MALIPCYECYKEISEKTPTCPHCGAPKDESPFTTSSFSDHDGGRVYFERWGGTGTYKSDGPYQSFFYEMGQDVRLCVNAFYKDGEKDGLFEWFGENGRILERVHYVNGKKEGAYVDSESAFTVETGQYYNGMKNGQFEVRYNLKWSDQHEHRMHGELEQEGTYKDGEYHGLYKEYYTNGRLKWELTYKDGKRHGPSRYYTEDGKLETEGCYDMGEKCGEWQHYHRTAIFRTLKVEKSTYDPCPPGLADGN